MPAPARAIPALPKRSRWSEWVILVAVVVITGIGAFTVLGGDVAGWWRGDSATPGDSNGPGHQRGPGGTQPSGPTGPAGPSGPAIGI